MKPRKPIFPVDGKISFKGRVSGGKTLYIAVRTPVARGIQEAGWGSTVLAKLTLGNGTEISFASVLRSFSTGRVSGVTQLPLPIEFHGRAPRGTQLHVELQTVLCTDTANLILPLGPSGTLDLFAYAPSGSYLRPTDNLVLRGLRNDLQIKRFVATAPAFWLAGFYQAEGSKSEGANEFTLAQANGYQLQDFYRVLVEDFSIAKDRIAIEVLYRPGASDQEIDKTVTYYQQLIPAVIRAVRPRSGRGGRACVLRVEASKQLLDTMIAWLGTIKRDELSATEALYFALGFIDGDSSITVESALRLGLYDTEKMARFVNRCLERSLGWRTHAVRYTNPSDAHRNLRIEEALDLLHLGAFRHSASRGRLLRAIDTRLDRVRKIYSAVGTVAFRAAPIDMRGNWRHEMVESTPEGWRLTQGALRCLELIKNLQTETTAYTQCTERLYTGIKGASNPLAETDPELYMNICHRVPWRNRNAADWAESRYPQIVQKQT